MLDLSHILTPIAQDLSAMDSNNFPGNVGVGEREGRLIAPLVAQRTFKSLLVLRHVGSLGVVLSYSMAHGIGRAGDVTAEQPKAAGSSLMAKLTCLLASHALDLAGMKELGTVTVLPLATGMALTMTLLAAASLRPSKVTPHRKLRKQRADLSPTGTIRHLATHRPKDLSEMHCLGQSDSCRDRESYRRE